jgi:hypothetical protein
MHICTNTHIHIQTYVDHALALGDVREQPQLQLAVICHDQRLSGLGDKSLADLVLVLFCVLFCLWWGVGCQLVD